MSFTSLSQTYRIAPRTRAVAPAPRALASGSALALAREPELRRDGERADDSGRAVEPDCDSVRRSPLLRALLLALQTPVTPGGTPDATLEGALIEFARALNLATSDVEGLPQPAPVRAEDAAQRRTRNEERLLAAFAELQHAAGRPGAATREALQSQLHSFLHALARHLQVDDERAGEATQPGSLISVHA